jgi:hypothetical protein
MTERDLTRAEVEAIIPTPSRWLSVKVARQLLRCMDERDEAVMQSLADLGQAQEAYDAQQAAEAEIARLREAEKELSDAYLRIRSKLNAYDTKPGGTDRFEVTEAALDAVIAESARLREVLERIADTDPDEGTSWFHNVARAALKPAPTVTAGWPLEEGDGSIIVGNVKGESHD